MYIGYRNLIFVLVNYKLEFRNFHLHVNLNPDVIWHFIKLL